jgi:hypothetical protein
VSWTCNFSVSESEVAFLRNKSKNICRAGAQSGRGGICSRINAYRRHESFCRCCCEKVRPPQRGIRNFFRNESVAPHILLCNRHFIEGSFLSSAAQRLRDVQTKSGKLIGMMKMSRWITGSLCKSYMTGRRVVGSQA